MNAERPSCAEGRMPGDAQLDQGAALDAVRPARQLLPGLEVREQVDHAVGDAPHVLKQLHLARRIALPGGDRAPADLDEPHPGNAAVVGPERLADGVDAARRSVRGYGAAGRLSRWRDRARRSVTAGEGDLREQRRHHLSVQAVADLRVERELMLLVRSEPSVNGQ